MFFVTGRYTTTCIIYMLQFIILQDMHKKSPGSAKNQGFLTSCLNFLEGDSSAYATENVGVVSFISQSVIVAAGHVSDYTRNADVVCELF